MPPVSDEMIWSAFCLMCPALAASLSTCTLSLGVLQQLRKYLYFCISKARKLSTSPRSILLSPEDYSLGAELLVMLLIGSLGEGS